MLTLSSPPSRTAVSLSVESVCPSRTAGLSVSVLVTYSSGSETVTLIHTTTTRQRILASFGPDGRLQVDTQNFSGEPGLTMQAYVGGTGGALADNRFDAVEARYVAEGVFPAGTVT